MKIIKKFMDILNVHVKSQSLSNFQDSMLMLNFLNEIGLDSTSSGEMGQLMHQSRHVQKQKAVDTKDALIYDIQSKISTKQLVRKLHLNIIQHLRTVISAHSTQNNFAGGGYTSASAGYTTASRAGYNSGEMSGGYGSEGALGLNPMDKMVQMPIEVINKILEQSSSHELLQMVIKEITQSYDKIGNRQNIAGATRIKQSKRRVRSRRGSSDVDRSNASGMDSDEDDQDIFMFHLHFTRKLSERLQVDTSARNYSKLERFLKACIEDYICLKLLNTDRQTIKWLTKVDENMLSES